MFNNSPTDVFRNSIFNRQDVTEVSTTKITFHENWLVTAVIIEESDILQHSNNNVVSLMLYVW